MADLLDFLPKFPTPPMGSLTPGGTPPFLPETDRLNIAGVPVAPIVAGGLLGLLNSAFAGRGHKAQAAGRGFLLGQQMFSQPIEEEKQNRRAMIRSMIDRGWLTPYGADGGIPAAPVMSDIQSAAGPTPLVSAPGTFGAGGSGPAGPLPPPPAAATPGLTFGGVRLSLAPGMTYGDIFGQDIPPALRNATTPASLGAAQASVQGLERQRLRDWAVANNFDPNTPTELILKRMEMQQNIDLFNQMQKQEGVTPTDAYTRTSMTWGPNGPQMQRQQLAPAEVKAREEAARDREAERVRQYRESQTRAGLARTQQEIETERLSLLKNKKDKPPIQLLQAQLQAIRDDEEAAGKGIAGTVDAAGAVLPGQDGLNQEYRRRYNAAYKKRQGVQRQIETYSEAPITTEAAPDPAKEAENAAMSSIYKSGLAAFATSKTPGPIDSFFVAGTPEEEAAAQRARETVRAQLDPIITQIEKATQGKKPFGIGPLRTSKVGLIPTDVANRLRDRYGAMYDYAVKEWAQRE